MFRLFKLLTYLREVNLSSEATLALIQRLETDSCRPVDYEVLIRVVRAHSQLSADDLDAFDALAASSAARRRPSQGLGAKQVERHSSGRGMAARGDAGAFPVATPHDQKDPKRDHGRGEAR